MPKKVLPLQSCSYRFCCCIRNADSLDFHNQDLRRNHSESSRCRQKSKEKKAETVAETPAPVVAAPVAPAQTDGVSDEVVAVISAAVATMYGSSEKARIKSIKKSSDGGRSAWAKAGVLDNTRPF